MGAIYGCIARGGDADRYLEPMSSALRERGGVDERRSIGDGVGLGSRVRGGSSASSRASSFASVGGATHVVMDGVLYNRRALEALLERHGMEPASRPDPEIVACLYSAMGPACIERFRGSFAIAVWDGSANELTLARDHIGEKPLFYAAVQERFFFASSARALAGVVDFELDVQSLSHFLSLRFLPGPHCLSKRVCKLPPAHLLTYGQDRHPALRRYWGPSFSKKQHLGAAEAVEGLDEKLSETVAAQLVDDSRKGAFLSSGLDSGLIVANMARILHAPFPTFSLGVRDETDEIPNARLVAGRFKTLQHEHYIGVDFIRTLPAMLWHLDEPSDGVLITKFLGAHLAASDAETVMSGDGGDELFCGYPRYLGVRDARFMRLVPGLVRRHVIGALGARLAGGRGLGTLAGKVAWLSEIASAGDLPERYAEAIALLRFRAQDKRELFTARAWSQVELGTGTLLAEKIRESDAESPIEKLLYADLLTRLPEHLLTLNDRAGAAHGVELRAPMADKELVEFCATLPVSLKVNGREAKYIERQLAGRLLPKEIVGLRKTGLRLPLARLFAHDLHPFLRSVFDDAVLVEHDVFRGEFVHRLLEEHRRETSDHSVRLWLLLCTEIWYRMMVERTHLDQTTEWIERHLSAPAAA